MSVVGLLVLVAVVGLIAWCLVTFVPMTPEFKKAIIGIAAIVLLLVVLRALFPEVFSLQVPTIH